MLTPEHLPSWIPKHNCAKFNLSVHNEGGYTSVRLESYYKCRGWKSCGTIAWNMSTDYFGGGGKLMEIFQKNEVARQEILDFAKSTDNTIGNLIEWGDQNSCQLLLNKISYTEFRCPYGNKLVRLVDGKAKV